MPKKQALELPPFHQELFKLLSHNAQRLIADMDMAADPKAQRLLEQLEGRDVSEIIASYHELLGGGSAPLHLEKVLSEAFPARDFLDLGLARYYPKVYRGLPREYLKDQPAQSRIKREFSYLAHLKRQAASKALFSLYSEEKDTGQVVVFTWVMPDGLGDFFAAVEAMRLLKARLPYLEIRLIALVHESMIAQLHAPEGTLVVSHLDKPTLKILKSADLVVQLPTFYPRTEEIMKQTPKSRWEGVGEYGFSESPHFSPRSGRFCMGLHFLEKGILTRKPSVGTWDEVHNSKLKSWHRKENRFYLAYLATSVGGGIYLHSLLKSLENDPLDVDLCTPELSWFFQFVERQQKMNRPLLEWDMGVGAIEIYVEDKRCSIRLKDEGKTVRLLCPGLLSQSDFRQLLALSGDWVAVRGNQSFSDAVSQQKAFFYDGMGHSFSFVKDWVALGFSRIGSYANALGCLQGMLQTIRYQASEQDEEWVDETYFQELEDWTTIALQMGLALQEPSTLEGFKKLAEIVTSECSANAFLCHLVKRALCHQKHPRIAKCEEEVVGQFVKENIGFKEMIVTLKSALDKKEQSPPP